ncbi:hypothetical protein [Mycobacterium asiaticum]|uniref:hypothetical protein n=1 Tax=Mycobacterium asiaticum TaxID=1790 RepID=UPI0006884814|nr:hypothetical protein [Mycobacterium asiaticum]ORA16378.1 hypothetical protein BST16_06640 [Mycobacterium asiaticum DSM 44297]
MIESNPFREEIEQILLKHPRTRCAKVLIGMKQNLTDTEMAAAAAAAGEPVQPDRITEVRRNVQRALDDTLATPSEAEMQAGLYRELLNYPRSPELRRHTNTRLAQLQQLDPSIKLTPLGDIRLGANDAPRPQKPEPRCNRCFMIHNGECL